MFLSKKTPLYFASRLRKFQSDRGGNIAIAAALMAPVVLGTFGLGTEVASWYNVQRQMQNAADSAATAAATNGSANFADEANAVTGRYGFTNGQGGVVVTAVEKQACPDGTNLCYRVTVKKPLPLALASLVGYQGNAKIGDAPAQLLTASATAIQDVQPRPYCIVALANSGASPALRTNGSSKADLTGCNVMSNTDAECNGHDLKADVGDAAGLNDGCGKKRNSKVKPIADQYAAMASAIPAVDCPKGFPVAPTKKDDPELPAGNQMKGTIPLSGYAPRCGDVQLTEDTIIDTPAEGAALVIRNGNLDLNGHTLKTSDGSAVTIIFTGENGPNYGHIPTGGGTLDIRAPNTGFWSGVAMYQNPSLTKNVNISEAGNTPTWAITGLVYLPQADVTLSGAINKSSYGASCFTLMVDKLLVNGTGNIMAHGECSKAGVTMPTTPTPSRGKLVS